MKKGFAGIGIIIVIVLAVAVISGGVYLVINENQSTKVNLIQLSDENILKAWTGDITGDQVPETVYITQGKDCGSCSTKYLYVYSNNKEFFRTSLDYPIVDTIKMINRKGFSVELPVYKEGDALCCPSSFSINNFIWNGNTFVNQNSIPSDWKTYTDSYGYQISYPANFGFENSNPQYNDPKYSGLNRTYLKISLPEGYLKDVTGGIDVYILKNESCSTFHGIKDYADKVKFEGRTVVINGINFKEDAGTLFGKGWKSDSEYYSIDKGGTCYAIDLHVRSDTYTKDFTPVSFDSEPVFVTLREVLNTFKFTK